MVERDPESGAETVMWIDDAGAFVQIRAEGGTFYQRVTQEQAEDSFLSNVLTRVIGGDTRSLKVDAFRGTLEVGDELLLVTDGVNKHVRDREVHEILEKSGSAEEACRALVDAALDGGGSDNVTAVHALDPRAPS